ncbi:MAG: hypothetical protein CMI52_03185 [Parcubacteria group bacterium]|nr:hypothetical protein [Parcubacteria group bacterium]|tara:strand:+ start:609 stop:1016 length:408 start_codon:yes stop_codon:yes gene_type:complete
MAVVNEAYWCKGRLTPAGVRFVRERAEGGDDEDKILSLMKGGRPLNARAMVGLYVKTVRKGAGHNLEPTLLPNMYVANGKLTKVGKARVHALAAKSSTITAQEILDEMGITEISERSMRATLAHAPTRRPPKKKK